MSVAITEAITTLVEAEQRFQLTRTENETFFWEWSTDLPSLESKKAAISLWSALPQTLTYLMAAPDPEKARFALMTNGDDSVFVKLEASPGGQYNVSRGFAALTSNHELYEILQILKRLSQVIQ
ncbi:hypothetical protein PGN35_027435 [Nodosilinea sp. PGN35]|uniref:hypothetical protein n=1 Tax=Nodosilinea sp. PGN35 TaxID=3020489 RepID=UPI0023B2270C|nr:hypothetical protein [Nodosilinea sp. TSF1-S3]MDF0365040.1 hypothetical protein [Nodosilinea sp. TSF1-S3]